MAAFAALHLRDDAGHPLEAAAHHALWLKLLCDWRIRRLLIIAPPESAKTTWVLSAYLGCRLGLFPEQPVIIASTSASVAEKRSLALRNMVESPEWQATFPAARPVPTMAWTQTEWSIAPEGAPYAGRLHPSVAAYGTGGSIIGSRAYEVIADDLIDYDSSRTQNMRELVMRWVQTSLISRVYSRVGRVVMIGTAWHSDDIYARAQQEGDWVVCRMPLLSESESVYAFMTYPDRWSPEIGFHGEMMGVEQVEALSAVAQR